MLRKRSAGVQRFESIVVCQVAAAATLDRSRGYAERGSHRHGLSSPLSSRAGYRLIHAHAFSGENYWEIEF